MIGTAIPNEVVFKGRQSYWICLLLVVVTLSVYWQVRNFEFVSYDDPLYVDANRHVQKGLTLETVVWSFTDATGVTNYWVPLTWLSILLDYELYGLNAGGYHLTNLLLHLLNVVLLFLLLRRMTGALWRSAFAAALFALHPLHVESVAWVTERKDVLSIFFWLATLIAYSGYVRRPGLGRYLMTLILFCLGMMAKPMLVTLPFVLLLLDYWPLGRLQSGSFSAGQVRKVRFGRLIWEKAPFFGVVVVAAIAAFWTQMAGGAVQSLALVPFGVRLINIPVAYLTYIAKLLYPVRLAFLYPHPGALPLWQWAGASLLLAIVTFLVLRFSGKRPYLAVGWLWYLGTLVPVIGLVVIGPHVVADRYTYVPLIGLYLLAAWGIPELLPQGRYRRPALSVLGVGVLAVLAAATHAQVRTWQNDISLYEHALAVNSRNLIAHNLLGNALEKAGRIDAAAGHYFQALQLNPENAETQNNIGLISARRGKISEAMDHFLEALRVDPNLKEAHYNLANVLLTRGDFDGAVAQFLAALKIDPLYAEAHNNLGGALMYQGCPSEAAFHFREALMIAPEYEAAHYNLGMVLIRQGKIVEAVEHLHAAVRIRPDYTAAMRNLSWALMIKRKIDAAVEEMEAALRIERLASENEKNMGALYKCREDLDRIMNQFKQGLSILPGFKPSELNLDNYPKVPRVYREYEKIADTKEL